MDQTPSMDADRALISLAKCNIHCFRLKQKGIISTGSCQVFANPSRIYFKGSSSGVEVSRNATLIRLRQLSYLTLLHRQDNGSIYSVSLHSNDPQAANLETILEEYVQIVDFYTLPVDSQLRQSISLECPMDQQLGMNNDDKLNGIGESIGNIFGGLSSLLPTDKINHDTEQTMMKVSRESLGDSGISRWERFKQKCANINEVVTEKMKPLSNKVVEIGSDVGTKFNNSDNSFIKGLREYSMKTEKALNNGYKEGEKPRRQSYVPPRPQNDDISVGVPASDTRKSLL